MEASSVRILVIGNVVSDIKALNVLLTKILAGKNGKFDVLFCVGNFFSENRDELKEMWKLLEQGLPIETYFIDGSKIIQPFLEAKTSENGMKIAKNVEFLGKLGIKEIKGLKIGFISGQTPDPLSDLGVDLSEKFTGPYVREHDLTAFISTHSQPVDLLLSPLPPLSLTSPNTPIT